MTKEYTILIVGDEKVGKTSFINQTFLKQPFIDVVTDTINIFKPTLNTTCHSIDYQYIHYNDTRDVVFNVWECPGNITIFEKYQKVYKKPDFIFYLCDQTNDISIENIKLWKNRLDELFFEIVPSVILGSKSDLVEFNKFSVITDMSPVQIGRLQHIHKEIKFNDWIYTNNTSILDLNRIHAYVLNRIGFN